MKLSGQTTVWSDRATAWAALHDVEILAASIPGCLALVRAAPDLYELSVEVSVGPVGAVLDGVVKVADCETESWLLLDAQGAGSAMLDLAGSVRISLVPCAVGCRVSYDAEIRMGGMLATWAVPLLSGLAQRRIDMFASRFAAIVGAPPKVDRRAISVRPVQPPS